VRHSQDVTVLREHLMSGAQCVDTWVALSKIFTAPEQRLYCLQRAVELLPEDEDLQLVYLSARLAADPKDVDAGDRLERLRVQRALRGHTARALRRRTPARSLGEILISLNMISEHDLRRFLNRQRELRRENRTMMLGDLLIAHGLLTPAALAHALTLQRQERADYGQMPHALGEYLVSEGYITDQDLALALAEQARLRQIDQNESIGKILIRQGRLTPAALQRALERQRQDSFASFH
jgi:hypothetical protein